MVMIEIPRAEPPLDLVVGTARQCVSLGHMKQLSPLSPPDLLSCFSASQTLSTICDPLLTHVFTCLLAAFSRTWTAAWCVRVSEGAGQEAL